MTVAASGDAFQTPDGRTPRRCTLMVRVQSLVLNNVDPVPGNDSYPLEVNIIDRGDSGRSAAPGVHLCPDARCRPVHDIEEGSPARCTARLVATGAGGDTDTTNDRTQLIIDVIDDNDL